MIFLIEYDRRQGRLVNLEPFQETDRLQAENTRLQKELDLHRRGLKHEVVLLDAASEGALRLTHRRYFEDLYQIASRTGKRVTVELSHRQNN